MNLVETRWLFLRLGIATFLSVAWLASSANAALVFAIGQNGSLLGSSLEVVGGSSFTLEFYVRQTGSSNEVTALGVNNADFIVTAPAGITHNTPVNFQPGLGFEVFDTDVDGPDLNVIVSATITPSVQPVFPTNIPDAVLLGTATFNVSSQFSGPQLLTVSGVNSLAVGFGTSLTNTRDVGAGSIQLSSATAVPEPSTMLLCVGCVAAAARRVAKKRKLAAT